MVNEGLPLDVFLSRAFAFAKTRKSYNERNVEDGPREYMAALGRAFSPDKGNADSIAIDSKHTMDNVFLMNGISYGLEKGLLYRADDIDEEQYFAYIFKLSDKGKKRFGRQ